MKYLVLIGLAIAAVVVWATWGDDISRLAHDLVVAFRGAMTSLAHEYGLVGRPRR